MTNSMMIAIFLVASALGVLVFLYLNKSKKLITIIFPIIVFWFLVGLFILNLFYMAIESPKVTMTKKYISTTSEFDHCVTIEKIKVDSVGLKKYPVKYTVTYLTSCHIGSPNGKPSNPPEKIRFNKEGNYWWTEENVNMQFIHYHFRRELVNSDRISESMGETKYSTCPLEFEKEQWYFVTIHDPGVTGIFFYIDKNGREHEYFIESGISPI